MRSKAKDELNRMLDVLNIQVDNPCAVLDQENSKKFLQGSERDKYAFFMKATDLDRILAVSLAFCHLDFNRQFLHVPIGYKPISKIQPVVTK